MRKHLLSRSVLMLVVFCGLGLRTWNINFDQGIASHPDERWTTCIVAPRIALPESWAKFRDPQQSPLNPLWNSQQQIPEYQ